MERGLIHVYTGNGKGKTTAALGLCLRAVGRGLKCCFVQFLKGALSGEVKAVKYLPNFQLYQTGRPDYDFKPNEEDRKRVREGFLLAKEKVKEVDLLVLDEINVAVYLGLIKVDEVLDFIKSKPKKVELVLTGRNARAEILEVADYATYFQLIKHPFYSGVKARQGIDF
ncbi:cob(I)yrinic acid a,c-diamide adenosyltransferase [Thermovibrio sp.]